MEKLIVEFGHLEKLCNDLYGATHGVTLYINEMQQYADFASRSVPGWSGDLANLKRIRHIRNLLVHEPDREVHYDAADIAFIKGFRQRILDRQDPLALLRKQAERNSQMKTRQGEVYPVNRPPADTDERNGAGGCSASIVLSCIVIAALIALLRGAV